MRDKDPKTLRDAYKVVVNIVNNRKASSKLGRRGDPKLFNPKNNEKREVDKIPIGKKPKEPTIGQVLGLLKKMNPTSFNAHKPNSAKKTCMNNSNFNRQPRM